MDASYFYKKGLCGLKNYGNTCYINSITQCLNNNRSFINYFLTNAYKEDYNDTTDMDLVEKYINIIKSLYKENAVADPHDYLLEIKRIASHDPCYKELIGYGQADSQEFLQFLLEKLHEQLKYKVNMVQTGEIKNDVDRLAMDAFKVLNTHFKNGYSKIIEEFYGLEYSKISSSTDKKYISETFSPFSTLAVEIPENLNNQELNLYQCLDKYTVVEKNITHKQHNPVVENKYDKQLQFWSLPDTLIILIKRYDNFMNKKNNLIDFPITNLNMLKYSIGYDNNKNVYDLFAISNHSGEVNGGHYWCYGKNSDGNWYNFNDTNITSIKPSDLITSNAYCLFYKKIK